MKRNETNGTDARRDDYETIFRLHMAMGEAAETVLRALPPATARLAAALNPRQHAALRAVRFARENGEKPMRLGELARRIGLKRAGASQLVDALAAKGLLARRPDPASARSVLILETPLGRRLGRILLAHAEDSVERFLSPLAPAERRRFLASARSLTAAQRPARQGG